MYHNKKAKTATLTLFTVVRGEDDAPLGKGNVQLVNDTLARDEALYELSARKGL